MQKTASFKLQLSPCDFTTALNAKQHSAEK